MKALISPLEPRMTGYRVAQVEQDENIFTVAEPFFWTDCTEDIKADEFWYDPINSSFVPFDTGVQV